MTSSDTKDAATLAEVPSVDPLREQLLAAAARVFASRGYSGTKIQDIVREAGLSSGAVYGRFRSKDELLIEAVTTHAVAGVADQVGDGYQVSDMMAAIAERQGSLDDAEAIQLEAFVAARREPEVATAIEKARRQWRSALEPTIQHAVVDGTVAKDADIESFLHFFEAVHLGLLLQRGAGVSPPHPERWAVFVREFLAGLSSASSRGRRRR